MAARQAFGIIATILPNPDKIANKTNPWTIDARGVLPPNLIFATVRIVAVAVVTPPKMPAAIFAIPCPNVSRSLLWRMPVILSATLQLKRLSSTASAANANAGPINSIVRFKSGRYSVNTLTTSELSILSPIYGIFRFIV